MKLRLSLSLLMSILPSVVVLPAAQAANYIAAGVNVSSTSKSSRFYDTGKGYYWTRQTLYNAASKLYSQNRSFSYLGTLASRINNPSGGFSSNSFSKLTKDANTCWYQASSNLIQYWLDTYSFYYRGTATLPQGYTYNKKYLSALGGTQSLKVAMYLYDRCPNQAGSLDDATDLFFNGNSKGGGFFKEYFNYNWTCWYSSYDASLQKTTKNLTADLLKGLGRDTQTGKVTEQGKIVYLSLSDIKNSDNGHAITCYGISTNSSGVVTRLFVCNSDDLSYKLFSLYVKKVNGKMRLYTNAACTNLWSYAKCNWCISGVSSINTPEKLQSIHKAYNDKTRPLVWNGHMSGLKWTAKSNATTSRKPRSSDGWDINTYGSGSSAYYFPTFYDPTRAVEFDNDGVNSKKIGTVNVVGTVSPPKITFSANSATYNFNGSTSSIITKNLVLGQNSLYNINVRNFTTDAIGFNYHYSPLELSLSSYTTFTCKSDVTCNNLTFTSRNSKLSIPNLTLEYSSGLTMKNTCDFTGNLTLAKNSTLTYCGNGTSVAPLVVRGKVTATEAMTVKLAGTYAQNKVYPLIVFDSMSAIFSKMSVTGYSGTYHWFYAGSSLCLFTGSEPTAISGTTWKDGVGGFSNGSSTPVLFSNDDTENRVRIYLNGNVSPTAVFVKGDGSTVLRLTSGSDKGAGRIVGNCSVIKTGSGCLHMFLDNTYTGGTIIGDGSVLAYYPTSFGTGNITMLGGTLYMEELEIPNKLVIDTLWTANVYDGNNFVGNLDLYSGVVRGDALNLATGKTATLRAGTLHNPLTGEGSVVKTDKGTVYLYGNNTYTGGTTVKNGTLAAKSSTAFGKGAVAVTGGTLHMGSMAIANTVNVNASTASIKGGALYRGNITLTKGTVSGDVINLYSGKTATLKSGTVKNKLTGAGRVIKNTSGTVVLAGTNNWTGNTYVQGGKLTLSGSTYLRGTMRTYKGATLDVRRSMTFGNLYLGGGALRLLATARVSVSGTLTLASATKLTVSGLKSKSLTFMKYGKIRNSSKLNLTKFFGLSGTNYTVTAKSGSLVLTKATAAKVSLAATEVSEVTETRDATTEELQTLFGTTASPALTALGQATWGTAKAATLFDHAVREHEHAQAIALDPVGQRSVWFASMSEFNRLEHGADNYIFGGALGMQFNKSNGDHVGLALGQTYGRVSPMGTSRVKQLTQHAAVYGTKFIHNTETDSAWLTATLSYGTTDSDTRQDSHRYDWTQHSVVIGGRGTWAHRINQATSVYAYAGLEYLATSSGSTENGDSGSVQQLEASVGAGISHTVGKLTMYAAAAFSPDIMRHNPVATSDNERSRVSNPGRLGYDINAGAAYHINEHWSANAGYSYQGATRSNSHEAHIGIGREF